MGRACLYLLPTALAVSACSVVGPLTDRDLSKAPDLACTRLPAIADAPQCLTLFTRGAGGETQPWTDGHLSAGDRVFAVKSSDAACQIEYDNLLLVGDTAGPGRMRLGFADAIGRSDIVEDFQWKRARTERRWVLRDVDTPYHIPGTARIEMIEGDARISRVCIGGYGD